MADMSLDNYVSSNKMALDLLYNSYHNDKLEDIVRKVYEKNKMLEYRDRLIQNADLIYLEPAAAGSVGLGGRAAGSFEVSTVALFLNIRM